MSLQISQERMTQVFGRTESQRPNSLSTGKSSTLLAILKFFLIVQKIAATLISKSFDLYDSSEIASAVGGAVVAVRWLTAYRKVHHTVNF